LFSFIGEQWNRMGRGALPLKAQKK